MRDYSEKEKEIIELIAKVEETNSDKFEKLLASKISWFDENLLMINPETKKAYLHCPIENGVVELNKFLTILAIVTELSEDGYFRKYTSNQELVDAVWNNYTQKPNPNNLDQTQLKEEFNKLRKEDNDKFIFIASERAKLKYSENQSQFRTIGMDARYDDIVDNLMGVAVISTRLQELVKNKFKVPEQVRHEKELRWSKASAVLALLALIAALVVPFCCDTTIDRDQVKEITQAISSVKIIEQGPCVENVVEKHKPSHSLKLKPNSP